MDSKSPTLPPRPGPSHLATPGSSSGLGISTGYGPATGAGTIYPDWAGHDPRTSSTQSLTPSVDDSFEEARRKLLVIFIHGFMGNDSSFRSFPAHLHSYLKMALFDSHVIHSKIYPRYKTYKSIDVARDNFSKWLEPHEGDDVDVVLVGHSMGGLLSAEVVMMPGENGRQYKHRILGTLNLDVPFVGLHPGIVVAGLSSLFRKNPDPPKDVDDADLESLLSTTNASGSLSPDPSLSSVNMSPLTATTSPTASLSTMATSPPPLPQRDPNYNAPFFNDVLFKDRGWWRNIAHFATKHKPEGLLHAARDHIISHLEFPSVLMDLVKLNQRYGKLRKLEDVDDITGTAGPGGSDAPMLPPREARVRFANFYTLSTGIKKRDKSPSGSDRGSRAASDGDDAEMGVERQGTNVHLKPHAASAPNSASSSLDERRTRTSGSRTRSPSPRISIEDHSDSSRIEVLQLIEPEPMEEEDEEQAQNNPPPYSEVDPVGASEGTSNSGEVRQSIEHDTDPSAQSATTPAVPATNKIPPTPASADAPASESLPLTATTTNTTSPADPTPSSPAPSQSTLPPIPPIPSRPTTPDFTIYTDKEARKQAEREHKRALKSHADAVKNHERAVRERAKLVEKAAKTAAKNEQKALSQKEQEEKRLKKEEERMRKEAERMAREADKLKNKGEKEREKEEQVRRRERRADEERAAQAEMAEEDLARLSLRDNSASLSSGQQQQQVQRTEPAKPPKPPKLRKFCTLPRGVAPTPDGTASAGDGTWIPVRMEGMDEVGAHCGLFFAGDHYQRLVGEAGNLVVGWVGEDATRRAIWGGDGIAVD